MDVSVPEQTIVLSNLGLGLIVMVVGIPGLLGRLRPNRLMGVRTWKTLSDEATWYRANKVAGRAFLVAGMTTIAATVPLAFLTRTETALVWVLVGHLTAVSLPVLVALIRSLNAAK